MTAVREARDDDAMTVRRILDAAVLEVDDLDERIAAGDVLVAVDGEGGDRNRTERDDDRILGALVLGPPGADAEPVAEGDGRAEAGASPPERDARVTAIAVRRRLRGRGIGTALVEAALEREGRLTAGFDADVRPFYEALDFSIERAAEGRYEGVLSPTDRW